MTTRALDQTALTFSTIFSPTILSIELHVTHQTVFLLCIFFQNTLNDDVSTLFYQQRHWQFLFGLVFFGNVLNEVALIGLQGVDDDMTMTCYLASKKFAIVSVLCWSKNASMSGTLCAKRWALKKRCAPPESPLQRFVSDAALSSPHQSSHRPFLGTMVCEWEIRNLKDEIIPVLNVINPSLDVL